MAARGFGHPLFLLTGMDALCIARSGSEELKRRFLPAIAAGKCKMAFAITEAGAGTNSFRMTTRAVRAGDHYVLDGEKTFITGIDQADHVLHGGAHALTRGGRSGERCQRRAASRSSSSIATRPASRSRACRCARSKAPTNGPSTSTA